MITLYQFATSPFAEKVRRALNFKGIDFEIHEVARQKVPAGEYKHVSPTGKFPTIQDGEQVVWDSTDIVYHLEQAHPVPALIPEDKRAAGLTHALEEWADESLYFYEMTMRLTWEHNLDAALDEFSASLPGIPKEQLKTMILQTAGQLTETQGIGRKPKDQVISDMHRHIDALDSMLVDRKWLVGDALTLADIAVVSQLNALRYASEADAAVQNTKHVLGWVERIDQLAPA